MGMMDDMFALADLGRAAKSGVKAVKAAKKAQKHVRNAESRMRGEASESGSGALERVLRDAFAKSADSVIHGGDDESEDAETGGETAGDESADFIDVGGEEV